MIWPFLIFLGVGAVGLAAFWDDIREAVLALARGWVRDNLGARAEHLLVEAVVMLDLVVSGFRSFVRRTIFAKTQHRSRAAVCVEEVPLEDMPDEVVEEIENEGALVHVYDT